MSILYPVAENAEAALHQPLGHATRERAARDLAGGAQVVFATEAFGPAFASREEALDAYVGRLDDDRPGKGFSTPPEARWCSLTPVAPAGPTRRPKTVRPVNREGRRWPAPDPGVRPALWRLSVSYWRIATEKEAQALEPARKLRRTGGERLEPAALRALASQPLRPVQPQQPLDIGLFETRPPEAPHIVMPDE